MYDITDSESFLKVRKWVKELRKIVGTEITITIAGNKADLEKSRVVSEKEVFEYAASVGATHFYTSAKQNMGLEECFLDLTKKIIERKKAKFGAEGAAGAKGLGIGGIGQGMGGANSKKLVVVDDDLQDKKKGGCC